MRRFSLFGLGLMALFLGSLVLSAQKKDLPKKDFSSELPKIPPMSPKDSLAALTLRPGFRAELVASEPLVVDPIALDFDEEGRMFVVEYPEYNQYANKNFEGHGCVVLLEDTNRDGRADKRTVYVDKLNGPSAVLCYDGGVFVGAAPDILFCKDTDGDGIADVRETVFTGFARDRAGEAMLNTFRWGLDNRVHLSTGLVGGNITRAGKKEKALPVRGQGLAFDPRSRTLAITGGGGQHGMGLSDWGRKFVCSNSEPIHLVMYDSGYIARNPYLQAPSAAVNIAPKGKYTKLFRISQIEPWRILRTRLRKEGLVRGSDEGGKPSGFFTGATGITVYRGDAWPASHRGNVLVGDVANNIVYRAKLQPKGVGFVAHRADEGVEFLASKDVWFRPAQFANAPDGTLYVIDMYRSLIEGAAFLPPEILRHMDVTAGLNRGRIYRIAPSKFIGRFPTLSKATTAELVALLEHPNGWHRDTASRLLYQRQDSQAIVPLRKLASGSKSPLGRTHALYALQGLSALRSSDVLPRLEDENVHVRQHALCLAESFPDDAEIRTRLGKMVEDKDIGVRYQLAFSLGAFPGREPTDFLAKLAQRDGADRWFRLAILSSASSRIGDLFGMLVQNQEFVKTVHGRTLLTELAQQVGAAARPAELRSVLAKIDRLDKTDPTASQALFRSLLSKMPAKLKSQVQKGESATLFENLLREAKAKAVATNANQPERILAIKTLALADFADVQGLLVPLLSSKQPIGVQSAALDTLARFADPKALALLLETWPTLSPKLRASATEALLSRPSWTLAFLDAVAKGNVARADLDPARIQILRTHPDAAIRAKAKKVFADTGLSQRKEVVARYQRALELDGKATRGKAVFEKNCKACHRLHGIGESIGADLSAIRDRGVESVLLNILDPNREVKPQFQSYFIETSTGRSLAGMIVAESSNSITVRKVDGTSETILRIDIEQLRSTGLSFMPEGLERQINLQAMADLLAYLNEPQ